MEVSIEVDQSTYHKVLSCLSCQDYWTAEREAHKRARERIAFINGKRVPYIVKMSVYAPVVDRTKTWLEDNFNRSRVQADVIVFKDVKQKKEFLLSGRILYKKYE